MCVCDDIRYSCCIYQNAHDIRTSSELCVCIPLCVMYVGYMQVAMLRKTSENSAFQIADTSESTIPDLHGHQHNMPAWFVCSDYIYL